MTHSTRAGVDDWVWASAFLGAEDSTDDQARIHLDNQAFARGVP
jgi:hypothetical protein